MKRIRIDFVLDCTKLPVQTDKILQPSKLLNKMFSMCVLKKNFLTMVKKHIREASEKDNQEWMKSVQSQCQSLVNSDIVDRSFDSVLEIVAKQLMNETTVLNKTLESICRLSMTLAEDISRLEDDFNEPRSVRLNPLPFSLRCLHQRCMEKKIDSYPAKPS